MKFKISFEDDIALLEIDNRAYDLAVLQRLLDYYTDTTRRAYAICEKYHIGHLGDSPLKVCLNELERRLETSKQKLDQTLR